MYLNKEITKKETRHTKCSLEHEKGKTVAYRFLENLFQNSILVSQQKQQQQQQNSSHSECKVQFGVARLP